MLSDLSAELQHWLPGWRCPLRWRWLCWSRFQTWMPPRTHRPPRPRCPRLPPDVSCRPCRDGRSWRGNADCPPGWTLGRIYRTGKVSPLRERNRQRREVNHLKSRGWKEQHQQREKGCLPISSITAKPHHYWILTSVNDNVLRQVSHINKCLVAHLTLVRPDIVVMPNVIGQLTGLHKPVQRET